MTDKRNSPANGAFSDLSNLIQKAGLRLKTNEEPPPKKAAPPPVIEEQRPETDEELFDQAMQDVTRPTWKAVSTEPGVPARGPAVDPDDDARRLMEGAINGEPALPVSEHPEYIEGWIGAPGRRFLPNLRNGLYSIQGQIDLHGLTRAEARITVEDFIVRMARFRSCCVKIIHGRGINSQTDTPVLKENLQRWLSTRRMARHVVAYASAPLTDGGVGAVYVLLRRQ